MAELLRKAREVATQTGIADQAKCFQSEAKRHNLLSKVWLGVTGILAIATGTFAWINYGKAFDALQTVLTSPGQPQGVSSPAGTTSFTIQLALAKVIAFSVLFSAVLWAGRIYRAHRHNYVVNKHRQNALSIFEVFAAAAKGDEQTKHAVLLQATQCIFSPQNTGYMVGEKETEGPSQFVEIIRQVTSAKN